MRTYTSETPLRDTTAWAGYREARAIPHRYGVCGGEALQYDDTRRLFAWADHPVMSVDAVFVGGQKSTGWAWRNGVDNTGTPVAFIEFSSPPAEGDSVIARGRGKLHATRGGLIDNAADVLYDILVNIGGLKIPESRFAAFRAQCTGLPVGGSIESVAPLFQIAREVCASIGAVCSPDMTGFARLWPGNDAAAVYIADRDSGATIAPAAILGDLCSDLTLRYAFEAGTPRGAVQYVAARTPAYGAQPRIVDAPWVSSARVAALVCERLLQLQGRPQWLIGVSGLRTQLRTGQFIELDHPLSPASGTHMIQAREYATDDSGDVTSVTVRAPAGPVPALRLVRNTSASEALPTITIPATQLGNEFEVTVIDDVTGQPLANAACTLDGLITCNADNAGIVKFPSRYATPGQHTIVCVVPGRPPVTLILTVE